MKNIIILVFFLILSISCSVRKISELGPSDNSNPLKPLVIVSEFSNHTEKELDKNKLVVEKLNQTLQSDCIRNKFLAANLIQTNDLTNEQVYEKITTTPVSIRLEMYYTLARVNGYTLPNTDKIWLNRRYHKNYGICSSMANLGHEVSHKIGFGHDYKPTKRRPMSVPYTMGRILNECCTE